LIYDNKGLPRIDDKEIRFSPKPPIRIFTTIHEPLNARITFKVKEHEIGTNNQLQKLASDREHLDEPAS
jgi:hypothetical protein